LSISRAVELWKDLHDSGRDPLVEYPTRGAPPALDAYQTGDSQIEIFQQDWLNACLAFDEIKAEETLNQAFAVYQVETVCLQFSSSGCAGLARSGIPARRAFIRNISPLPWLFAGWKR
jgi:hypothetical protein